VKHIASAWIEGDNKLCIRLEPDSGAETLGLFHPRSHEINVKDFVGKSQSEACDLFNSIVYPDKTEAE